MPLLLHTTTHLSFPLLPISGVGAGGRRSFVIRMGGGPRTYPGGVSKWQWKRMQAKKAKQLLKARLCRERQLYEMRKRAEIKAAVSQLERPWEVVERPPNLFSVGADEQLKVLADRFQRPGGFDMWTHRDGPQVFREPVQGLPSARFFPQGSVHSVKPYGVLSVEGEEGRQLGDWNDFGDGEVIDVEAEDSVDQGSERNGRFLDSERMNARCSMKFPDETSGGGMIERRAGRGGGGVVDNSRSRAKRGNGAFRSGVGIRQEIGGGENWLGGKSRNRSGGRRHEFRNQSGVYRAYGEEEQSNNRLGSYRSETRREFMGNSGLSHIDGEERNSTHGSRNRYSGSRKDFTGHSDSNHDVGANEQSRYSSRSRLLNGTRQNFRDRSASSPTGEVTNWPAGSSRSWGSRTRGDFRNRFDSNAVDEAANGEASDNLVNNRRRFNDGNGKFNARKITIRPSAKLLLKKKSHWREDSSAFDDDHGFRRNNGNAE